MAYDAKHELPITAPGQDGPWPDQLQLPIQTRRIVDASQGWYDLTTNAGLAAEQIEDYYSSSIANFVAVQRRDYAQGSIPVVARWHNLPGLNMMYENRQGTERLTLVAKPESAPMIGQPTADFNFDGYILWVHAQPNYPDDIDLKPTTQSPYDIFLNGYLIYDGYQITQAISGFIIMFGKTSIRCHSLNDDTNPFKTGDFGKNPIWGPNAGLVNPIIPTPADVQATDAPDGLSVPQHKNIPVYPMFDWDNVNNPGSLFNTGTVHGHISWERWSLFVNKEFNITQGLQFADPKKSPLNWKGQNYLTVMLKSGVGVAAEIETADVVVCEFYDRNKSSGLVSSWNYTVNSQVSSIVGNTTPLIFAATQPYFGFGAGINMGFDLTPANDKDNGTDDALIPTPAQGPNSSLPTLVGLTEAQQQALTAYGVTVAEIEASFNATQGPIITAAIDALQTAEDTETNIQTYIGAYNDGTFNKGETSPDEFSFENFFPHPTPYTGDDMVDVHIAESIPEPGLWIVNQSEADFYATILNASAAQDDIIATKTTAYEAAITATPHLPPIPPDAGNGIDPFVWRTVDISGGDWSFGGWSSP